MNLAQQLFGIAQKGASVRSTYHFDKICKLADEAAKDGKFRILYKLNDDEELSEEVIQRLKGEGFRVDDYGYDEDSDDYECVYSISWEHIKQI